MGLQSEINDTFTAHGERDEISLVGFKKCIDLRGDIFIHLPDIISVKKRSKRMI